MRERDITFDEVEQSVDYGSEESNKDIPGGKTFRDRRSGITVHTDDRMVIVTVVRG